MAGQWIHEGFWAVVNELALKPHALVPNVASFGIPRRNHTSPALRPGFRLIC